MTTEILQYVKQNVAVVIKKENMYLKTVYTGKLNFAFSHVVMRLFFIEENLSTSQFAMYKKNNALVC